MKIIDLLYALWNGAKIRLPNQTTWLVDVGVEEDLIYSDGAVNNLREPHPDDATPKSEDQTVTPAVQLLLEESLTESQGSIEDYPLDGGMRSSDSQ